MKTKVILNCCMLFMLTMLVTSCKKKDTERKNDVLQGAWAEIPPQSYPRRMLFESNGKFSMEMLGTNGYPQLTLNGKYAVKGDSLSVNILETLEKQDSGKIIKAASNINFFDKATFSVKDLVLTINYVSYSADAPVSTQMKFSKILSID